MGHLPPQLPMLLSRLVDDMKRLVFKGLVEPSGLFHFWRSLFVSHDIFPCIGVGESKLIRRNSDNVAIAIVELQHIERECSSDGPDAIGDPADCVGYWARELAEWMEKDIIKSLGDEIRNDLVFVSQCIIGIYLNSL
jgi:hypothetical protein